MDIIHSIIFGIVQGLTEFLPISSSGHLVILHNFLGFNLIDNLAFDVSLHLGTLMALLIFFWQDMKRFSLAFFRSFKNWNLKEDINQRLAWFIVFGCIPAFIVGFLMEEKIMIFRTVASVAIMLIGAGILLLIFEKLSKKINDLSKLDWLDVLIIGLAQSFAIFPGVSRSGITIIAGLGQKLKREEAARFSFLLSIPVIAGAGIKKIYDLIVEGIVLDEVFLYVLGFFSALAAGYFCIKYFLKFLQSHSLNIFAFYRIVLGVVIILYFII